MNTQKSLLDAARETLTEGLGYSATQHDLQDAAIQIAGMPGGKLEKFFIALSDEFMLMHEDDSSRVNAKTLATNLLKLSKLAREI